MATRRSKRFSRPLSLLPSLEACEPRRLLATTYYVSPSGSDSNAGTSASAPWKTVSKVNSVDLNAGDQVLFQGGQTFVAPSPGSNQVSDSGFESGNLNSWTENFDATAGNSTITSTPADVHSGAKALRVGGTGAGGRGQVATSKVKANKTYLFKVWAKASSGTGEAYAGISFYSGATSVGTASVKISGTSYKQYVSAVTAPSSFDFADVWVTKADGTSVLFVDDFSLAQTTATLVFDQTDSGTTASPVTIGSYGSGRATINAGDGDGLVATNVAGFTVRDLNFLGTWDGLTGGGTNVGAGIAIRDNLANDAKLDFIRIDNVDASKFKWYGISIDGQNAKAGFRDVRITNSAAHDNGDAGINIDGRFDNTSTLYAHSNVYIGYCKAYNNGGIPNKGNNSGSGIVIGDVDGGIIERCVAWNNGSLCNFSGGGPIGIWAWDSNNVTIQYNESYANKTGSTSLDGGGFDLDGGMTNSVLQYNYSHDNYGAGYLLYQFTTARPYNNNTVRYNISQNDARDGHYAGIYLGGGSAVTNSQVYNNTIYLTPGPDPTIAGIKITGVGTGNKLRNNIIQTTGGVKLLDANSAYATSSVQIQGNDYYASGGTFGIKWGSSTTYSDLSSWRGTGQEKNGASNTGQSSNPQLVSAGGGPALGDASKLETLVAYQLLATSPLVNSGLNLSSLFGVTPGSRDFFGSALYAGSGFDIGAFEAVPAFSGGAASENFTLRLNAAGNVELFVNTPTSSTPTKTWAKSVYTNLAISGNSGDDTLTLDLVNGNPLPSGGATFDGGPQNTTDAIVVAGTAGADNVVLNSSAVTPAAGGPSLTYIGVGAVSVNTGAGNDSLAYSGPLAPSVSYNAGTGSDVLAVNSGTFTLNGDGRVISPNLTVSVAAGASAVLNGTQHLAALNIAGNVTIPPGAKKLIVTRSLNITGAGRLDLNDNDMIIDYSGDTSPLGQWTGSAYTGIIGMVAAGRNGGLWNGPGLASAAAANAPVFMTLAVTESSTILDFPADAITTSWEGENVDTTCVLIKYTYGGDADLNGVINSTDYFGYDAGIGGATPPTYSFGDFDYDGRVDADDQYLLDSNWWDQFYVW